MQARSGPGAWVIAGAWALPNEELGFYPPLLGGYLGHKQSSTTFPGTLRGSRVGSRIART